LVSSRLASLVLTLVHTSRAVRGTEQWLLSAFSASLLLYSKPLQQRLHVVARLDMHCYRLRAGWTGWLTDHA